MVYNKLFQYLWMRRAPEYRGQIFQYRSQLEENERLSPDALQQLQWNRLKRLLEHAYEHVPFYRKRFDEAGLSPVSIRTPNDFQRLPILTRQDVQANLEQMVAATCDFNNLRRNTTSGSTGNPTAFYQDRQHMASHEAAKMRYRAWFEFEMGDKVAFLWGAARDMPQRSWLQRQRVHYIDRKLLLNSFNMTTERMEQFARQLVRWQPKYIISYVSSIYLFAAFLREQGFDGIRPVAIETSAEKLWDFQRTVIQEVFQSHIVDAYGSRETPCVAAECEAHEGLHVFSDVCYLELLRNGRPSPPGEAGEIVVTDLNNYAMPLIRYQNGDLAKARTGNCSCGRPFPLLEEIVGRTNTLISTPNGQYVHGAFFSYLLYSIAGVHSFQVHQTSLGELEIKIEGNGTLQDQDLSELHQKIVEQLGPGMQVSLRIVDAITKTPTGKHKYIVSDVPLPFVTGQESDVLEVSS